VKAGKVKKLDPAAPLAENAARIARARLDELRSFAPAALKADNERQQHDMRIAAKRLRYVLEATEFCFDKPGSRARRRAKALQDVLGELHDCDVMLPRVEAHLAILRENDAAAVHKRAGRASDLDPKLAARAPHRTTYRGLEVLAVYVRARRKLLFDRFTERWAEAESDGVWDDLERAGQRILREAKQRRKATERAERAERDLEEAERARAEASDRACKAAADLAAAERVAPGGTVGRED
jgi:nitrogen fixation-related uncharacterized protein